MIVVNVNAQRVDNSGLSSADIDKINNMKPGETIRPEDTKGDMTVEQYRQWLDAVREVESKRVKPYEKPVINYPDFTKMTEKEIFDWQDSILYLLYPPIEPFDKEANEETSFDVEKDAILETRMGYYNNFVPISAAIDDNMAVGEIPFTSSVLPNGALTYNVPIEIYPGINGLQPNISVAYNSFGGEGVMGVGWNIGGLSSISRTSKSLYYDDKVDGVKIDKNDAFVLDGVRLIKKSENSTQIHYVTETGNIKVIAYVSGNNTHYFKVWYPNGSTGTYGTVNSIASSYTSYPLTQLTDRFNNTITYAYNYYNNHYLIDNISYGNASVVFNYDWRSEVPFYYLGGLKITEQYQLQSIDVKYN